ncbi:hypothetical protein A7U60_g5672 [Sanghuangporus baumii]|uniref:DUF6533 domain-containing protein n=1 Tax=Sanghuangporus baumii TaxID=108892 RepID=A0A9Q5HW92_SANBA|nr:hypothetical protein A7U60_g5672 [Sanghuangporus baumii]
MSNSTILMLISARSNAEPIDPSFVPSWVQEQTLELYFHVMTTVVLVYDTIITMDSEIKYFWKIPRNMVDFVYFANRYIGIFGAVAFLFWDSNSADLPLEVILSLKILFSSDSDGFRCNFSKWANDIASWITIIAIDYILMIRVLALYSHDKALSICLRTLLALESVLKLGLISYLNALEHLAVGELAKGVTVCGEDSAPPWQLGMADWIIPMVYASILMVLALYKAAQYWKMSAGFKGFTLLRVLLRDQVLYFMLAISCSVFAIAEYRLRTTNLLLTNVLNSLGNPSFLCVLGSRMLVNLKEAAERGQNEGTSYRAPSTTLSDIDFEGVAPFQSESDTIVVASDKEA